MKAKKMDKELKTYTAAAGAVLAGAATANAEIHYSGILDLTVSESNAKVFDFNSDSTTDMALKWEKLVSHFSTSYTVSGSTFHSSSTSTFGKRGVLSMGNGGAFLASGLVKNFALNETIPAASAGVGVSPQLFVARSSGTEYGYFLEASGGYIGFRFDPNGESSWNYGWVHVSEVALDHDSYKIDGWAYDDSGASILAGQTEAIPEPGALTLLAAGAAGMLGIRKIFAM